MKKFLFTLAAIVSFGFAANAQTTANEFKLVTPTNFNSEDMSISIDPTATTAANRRATFHFNIGGIDQPVNAMQMAYQVLDSEGKVVGPDGPVHIRAVGGNYFRQETSGPSTLPNNAYGNNYKEEIQAYMLLAANVSYGVIWELQDWVEIDCNCTLEEFLEGIPDDEVPPIGNIGMLTYPANVIQFQIEVNEGWDGEYVDFKFVNDQFKMTFYNLQSDTQAHPEFDFRVYNANYSSTQELKGTVVIGDNNGYEVPVTVDVNGTYDLVVTVAKDGGEAVEVPVTDGKIVLGQTPDYGTYVINATATGNGDYTGTVTAETKTITIDQLTADEPTITFTQGETGVTINVENYTSYEVIVNGVNKGQINFVEKDWVEQTIVVNATNAPAGYIAANATEQTTLGKKENNQLTGTISIGAVENETGKIYVSYSGDEQVTLTATANGEPINVVDGYITLPEYGEYEIVVTATPADEHTDALESGATRVWNAPELAEKPVITFTPGETGVTIDVENYTSYEVIVNGENKGQINFVEKDWVAQTIVVNATNAPAGYYEANYATAETTLGVKDNYQLAGTITIGAVDQATGKVHVAYVGEEDVTLEVTVNATREVVTINGKEGDIQLPDYGTYDITVKAVPAAAHTDSMEKTEQRTWNAPSVYTVVEPTVTAEQTATEFVINVTPNDPYATTTLFVTVTDMEGVSTTTQYTEFPVKIARDENDYMISYYATATLTEAPAGYDDWTNASTKPVTDFIDALPTLQGGVNVTVDEQGNVTAEYTGLEDVTIVVNPSHLDNYGEDIPVTVTVTAEGYQDLVVNTTVDYTKPAPTEQADAPTTNKENFVYRDKANNIYYNAYTITLSQPTTSDDQDYVIYYRVGVLNPQTGEYEYPETYTEYTGPFNVTQEGIYMVDAYAVATDRLPSNHTQDGFTVSVATSIEELFAGENVASIRYFNVAGQEMKEVNGLTIVVTTFTNGTQSAVKVME